MGRPTSSIRAWALREGKFAPIPFQVDERDPKGRWAIEGPNPVTDDSPGAFDADDTVVLLDRDVWHPMCDEHEAMAFSVSRRIHFDTGMTECLT